MVIMCENYQVRELFNVLKVVLILNGFIWFCTRLFQPVIQRLLAKSDSLVDNPASKLCYLRTSCPTSRVSCSSSRGQSRSRGPGGTLVSWLGLSQSRGRGAWWSRWWSGQDNDTGQLLTDKLRQLSKNEQ